MRPYRITETRNILVKIVAEKTKRNVSLYGSALGYLGNNYFVVINDELPEFIYMDDENGLVVNIHDCSDKSTLVALAKLKLFHYMLESNENTDRIMLAEIDLFLEHYNSYEI